MAATFYFLGWKIVEISYLEIKQFLLENMLKHGFANKTHLLSLQQRLSAIEVQYGLSLSTAETAALQSYLSQSQFGLASIYDHQ